MCVICFSEDFVQDATRDLRFEPAAESVQGGGRGEAGTTLVTATGIAAVDALLQGRGWTGPSVTFSFPTASSQYTDYIYYGATELPTFSMLSLEFREAVRQILGGGTLEGGAASFGFGSVSSFTNINFTEVSEGAGTMRFAFSTYPTVAWGYYPWETGGEGGDAWFNPTYMGARPSPAPGTYTWMTAIHEIGHTLGLKHAHETGGIINAAVPSDRDSVEFTVMTYRSFVGGSSSGYSNESVGYPQTFMMLDIRALQQMYGADFTLNATNTVYTWNPTTGEMSLNGVGQGAPAGNRVFLTIWDGGGVDTYDFSNYSTGGTIDLTAGGHSLFSTVQRANLGHGNYARGNVFNALQYNGDVRSLIENAIGTSGADTIIGNQANNSLQGGDGADILYGHDGDDLLNGGLGADTAYGGAGNDTYVIGLLTDQVIENAGEGVDLVQAYASFTLSANVENMTMLGGALNGTGNGLDNVITGTVNANYILGEGGADTLSGMDGNDLLNGGAGDDVMIGGLGDDTFVLGSLGDVITELAGEGSDTVQSYVNGYTLGVHLENLTLMGGAVTGYGNGLNNVLTGTDGANFLYGRDGHDQVYGGLGNDTLYGEGGNDFLNGGSGDDVMNGGLGDDLFVVGSLSDQTHEAAGEGDDTVQAWVNHALWVNVENLELYGAAQYGSGNSLDNEIIGNGLDNWLYGHGGNDRLEGGTGNDRLFGGAGAGNDVFVQTGDDFGHDILYDFQAGAGVGDVVRLSTDLFEDFADILAHATDLGGSVVIAKGGQSITINGVLKAALHANDFQFGTDAAPLESGGGKDAGPMVIPGLDPVDPLVLPSDFSPKGSDADIAVICPVDPVIADLALDALGGQFAKPMRQAAPAELDWTW